MNKEIQVQREIVHKRKGFKELDIYGLYKALNCVQYQIEIEHLEELGGVTEEHKKALKFLEILQNWLAHHIAHKSERYDQNEWEIY